MKDSNKGLSLSSFLTILFIILKLTGVIDWSWFWVLSPAIIPLLLVIIIVGVSMEVIKHLKEEDYISIIKQIENFYKDEK